VAVVDQVEGKPYDNIKAPVFSPDGKYVAYEALYGEDNIIVTEGVEKAYDAFVGDSELVFDGPNTFHAFTASDGEFFRVAVGIGPGNFSRGQRDQPVNQTPQPSAQRVKSLIEQLVSPNPKSITGEEDKNVAPDYRLPPGFDREKQQPVRWARYTLRRLGPQAFPALIERWGDDRYCVTVSHRLSGYCRNRSVGDICREIVFDQIQPYSYWQAGDDDPRGRPRRPSYPAFFLGSQAAARQWCGKNQNRTLHEIQLEALEWVIAEEGKHPRDFTDKERQTLQKIHGNLIRDQRPIPPGNYDFADVEQ
jgi:hypothetical protein